MADPYEERSAGPGAEGPAHDPELADLALAHGAIPVSSCAELASAQSGGRIVVQLHGEGLLPPICRLSPEQAVLLLAGACDPPELAAALRAAADARELLAAKRGLVGGPAGAPGAFEVGAALLDQLLDAAAAGAIGWERDPDFGYEVAADVEGVAGAAARALLPRLLYADHDRVYEHADLVAEVKRRRHAALVAGGEVPAAVLAASGWPIEPTGQTWKD